MIREIYVRPVTCQVGTGGKHKYSSTHIKLVARTGWAVKVTRQPLYLQEGELLPTLQEVGWASGPGWMFPENLSPHDVSSPGPSCP